MRRLEKNLPMFLILAVAMTIGFVSCTDKDQVAPTVVLQGPETLKVTLNDRYIEYGVEVYDNRDDVASLEVTIVHEIDTLEEDYFDADGGDIFMGVGATIEMGEFIVQYIVKDEAGNETKIERLVIIENSLAKFAREYVVSKENISVPSILYEDYNIEVEVDENVNNRIWYPRFSDLQFYNLNVYADVIGADIFIPIQSFPDQNNYVIKGIDAENNGWAGTLNRTDFKMEIHYTASNNTNGTQEFKELFVKF